MIQGAKREGVHRGAYSLHLKPFVVSVGEFGLISRITSDTVGRGGWAYGMRVFYSIKLR